MPADPFYISTAISYPNGRPHIGHAYEAIAADAIARYHRLQGRDVYFQTGTDEHGLKMVQTARDKNVDVADLAREMSLEFKAMCDALDVSYDRFIRTSEPEHHAASQTLWRAMESSGDLYKGRYEGWYSVRDEAFYDEKEITTGRAARKSHPKVRLLPGRSRKAGSFACRNISSRCWNFTVTNPTSSSPIAAAMK